MIFRKWNTSSLALLRQGYALWRRAKAANLLGADEQFLERLDDFLCSGIKVLVATEPVVPNVFGEFLAVVFALGIFPGDNEFSYVFGHSVYLSVDWLFPLI